MKGLWIPTLGKKLHIVDIDDDDGSMLSLCGLIFDEQYNYPNYGTDLTMSNSNYCKKCLKVENN